MRVTTTAGQIRQAQRDQAIMRSHLNRLSAALDLLDVDLNTIHVLKASDRLDAFLLSLTESNAPVEIEVRDD